VITENSGLFVQFDIREKMNTSSLYSSYKAVIIGASGAVGGGVLQELLLSPKCSVITSLGRKEFKLSSEQKESSKFTHHIVDLDKLESASELVAGHDFAFCTLGVGQPTKVSLEYLTKVEYDYIVNFGKICKAGGVKHISLLSSINVSATSMINALKVKWKTETAIQSLEFDRCSFFRPSLLVTQNIRYGLQDSIVQAVFPKLTWMLPSRYHEISVENLGRAMRINSEQQGKGVEFYEYPEFVKLLSLEENSAKTKN